jgi:hypothetical protein
MTVIVSLDQDRHGFQKCRFLRGQAALAFFDQLFHGGYHDQVSGLDPIHFPSPWRIRRIGPSGSRNTQYPVWGHPTITNLRSPAK